MKLPVLGMLRNPDRMFILVELAFAALCAYAWEGVADRIASRPLRALVWTALAALLSLELSAVPLRSFAQRCSPYFAELARDPGVASLMELPPARGPIEGRYNLCQTVHGKKIPQGYVTNLAITSQLESEVTAWHGACSARSSSAKTPFCRGSGSETSTSSSSTRRSRSGDGPWPPRDC